MRIRRLEDKNYSLRVSQFPMRKSEPFQDIVGIKSRRATRDSKTLSDFLTRELGSSCAKGKLTEAITGIETEVILNSLCDFTVLHLEWDH